MNVKDAIEKRRAYRSLDPVEISDEVIGQMARAAQLAPSCFNNQPWNFIFVRGDALADLLPALPEGNAWAGRASMIIVVFSKKEDDCVIRDRAYYSFDTGIAIGQLILRATEMGLVAHPIAGYSPKKTREILAIPEECDVIALVIVGKKAGVIHPELSKGQAEAEGRRPERKALAEFIHIDRYGGEFDGA